MLAPYSETLALGVMVVVLTYVSLILGELVPKRLALTNPEAIASVIARPINVLASIGRPIVTLLSVSTDTILRLFGVRQVKQPAVTLEEIRVLLEQGADEGVFEGAEHEMVANVLNLDDRHVGAVLTPRSDIVFLDIRDPEDVHRDKLRQDPHSVVPLCDRGLDHVLGFVRSTRLLDQVMGGGPLDLRALAEPAFTSASPRSIPPPTSFAFALITRRVCPTAIGGSRLRRRRGCSWCSMSTQPRCPQRRQCTTTMLTPREKLILEAERVRMDFQ